MLHGGFYYKFCGNGSGKLKSKNIDCADYKCSLLPTK
jgi:hypothetical protein